ncbi:DUF2865 domain-containing protein [Bradyrhizobium sp. 41S5]|uniref:DUF2865 domain-containing protein n=1 Tax=Bradyrhizobium sp. 41S5 TaxID=1404443 RepID=UPI001E3D521A|nr:DUF2865 domain-containing protein [Bradyrhizobium sp. 41S5]UFX45265.1 DUF2865 domain-containing protein [Bradyrhizobium sp. 41S5]
MKARPLVRAFLLFGSAVISRSRCRGPGWPPLPTAARECGGTCKAVCPAAEVKLHSGSDIASARTEAGESYKALANAFRFRREVVPRCACVQRGRVHRTFANCDRGRHGASDRRRRRGRDGFKIAVITSGQKCSLLFRPLSRAKAQTLGRPHLSLR